MTILRRITEKLRGPLTLRQQSPTDQPARSNPYRSPLFDSVVGRVPDDTIDRAQELFTRLHYDNMVCGDTDVVAGWWIETHTLGCRNAADEPEDQWWDSHEKIYNEYLEDGMSHVVRDGDTGIFVTFTPQWGTPRTNPSALPVRTNPKTKVPHGTDRVEAARLLLNDAALAHERRMYQPRPEPRLQFEDPIGLSERLLANMDPRKRRILVQRYGLDGQAPMTFEQIGQELQVTRERVRQLESLGIYELHRALEATKANPGIGHEVAVYALHGASDPLPAVGDTISLTHMESALGSHRSAPRVAMAMADGGQWSRDDVQDLLVLRVATADHEDRQIPLLLVEPIKTRGNPSKKFWATLLLVATLIPLVPPL